MKFNLKYDKGYNCLLKTIIAFYYNTMLNPPIMSFPEFLTLECKETIGRIPILTIVSDDNSVHH